MRKRRIGGLLWRGGSINSKNPIWASTSIEVALQYAAATNLDLWVVQLKEPAIVYPPVFKPGHCKELGLNVSCAGVPAWENFFNPAQEEFGWPSANRLPYPIAWYEPIPQLHSPEEDFAYTVLAPWRFVEAVYPVYQSEIITWINGRRYVVKMEHDPEAVESLGEQSIFYALDEGKLPIDAELPWEVEDGN